MNTQRWIGLLRTRDGESLNDQILTEDPVQVFRRFDRDIYHSRSIPYVPNKGRRGIRGFRGMMGINVSPLGSTVVIYY